jgi:SAM-dependent methyltransferase
MTETDPFLRQQAYYKRVAHHRESLHDSDEIDFSLILLEGYLRRCETESLLDVGSGAGRVLSQLVSSFPGMDISGIEPSEDLRAVAHERYHNLKSKLADGNAYHLEFPDNSIDIVTEFAVLHHVHDPRQAVREIVRVAKQAVFLVDTNNWGQGSPLKRLLKLSLRYAKLWDLYIHISTRGQNYKFSEGDGVYYSFSLYDIIDLIRPKFPRIYIMNADAKQTVHYGLFQAPGLCVLAIKE